MTNLTINLTAADGATGSISATLPPINAPTTYNNYSLFVAADVPPEPSVTFSGPITYGTQFTVDRAGQISAIKFYNQATGAFEVGLWQGTTLLASANYTSTQAGWQTAPLATPVQIVAGTTYTAGYFTSNAGQFGRAYSADTPNGFANFVNVGPITAAANAGRYDNSGAFAVPASQPEPSPWDTTNYYVDVVFQVPVVAPPAGAPTPTPWVPHGYIYAWGDEFTSDNLDITKWWTRYAGNGGTQQNISSNGEQQLFSESNNHVMTGSSVKLTAYAPVAPSTNYLSGMLRGKKVLNLGSLTTGFYIEMEAKMPAAYGAWPAFWAACEPMTVSGNLDSPWPPEMDFAEFMIQDPALGSRNATNPGMNVKYNNAGLNASGVGTGPWNGWVNNPSVPMNWTWNGGSNCFWETPVDFSAGFHVFAVQWAPGAAGSDVNPVTGEPTHTLKYFIDGVCVQYGFYDAQIGADNSMPYNLELLFDLAVGGAGGLTPNPSMFPCVFEIKNVRVYTSQNDPNALVTSTIGQDFMPSSGG